MLQVTDEITCDSNKEAYKLQTTFDSYMHSFLWPGSSYWTTANLSWHPGYSQAEHDESSLKMFQDGGH
jgi:hypothetical protein